MYQKHVFGKIWVFGFQNNEKKISFRKQGGGYHSLVLHNVSDAFVSDDDEE